jgi:hypothetical protein
VTNDLTPPPEREPLPPAVHARVRAELLRQIHPGPRARTRRRLPLAIAAGVAVVVVSLAAALLVARPHGTGPRPATSGPSRPDDGVVLPPAVPSMPTWTPGQPQARASAGAEQQQRVPQGWRQPKPTSPLPLDQERLALAECLEAGLPLAAGDRPEYLQMFTLFHDRVGRVAWFLGRHGAYACESPAGSNLWGSDGGVGHGDGLVWYAWLGGDASVDETGGAGSSPAFPHGYAIVAGRVSARTSRVVVSFAGGGHVTATVANGTFLARIPRPAGLSADIRPAVAAYDERGASLPVTDANLSTGGCYQTPWGEVIAGPTGTTCHPAAIWP